MNKSDLQIDFKTVKLFREIAQIVAPPPILTVSQWADRYRKLSAESAAEPGQWNTDRAPYQREILDAVNDPACEEVVIMSSAQVGKTELILNTIGYYVDYDPAPILVVQPTLDMAQAFSKDRLAPMIRDTPALTDKVKDSKSRDSGNTILHKKFPGGHITMAGANSPASLASRPIRIVLMDETDRYPASAGGEGNPIKLAEKRTNTFWNRKKIKVSTPTIKGESQIEKEFLSGSQEEWCVPCPCCGRFQPYEWGRIHFSDATMECSFCGEHISEMDWKQQTGKYIAKFPDRRRKRSFHLNELASPWKHWEEIIRDFQEANKELKENGDINKMKTFINTSLGETWEERGKSADDDSLLSRRERYEAEIPDGVLLLTAGVDVQDDRFEVEITGWGRGYESWGIRYEKIFGDLEKDETWDRLEEYLDRELYFASVLPHLHGADGPQTFAASAYDSTGYFFDADDARLVLVNANLPFDEEPSPTLDAADEAGTQLEAEAAQQYRSMAAAAQADGITLTLVTGYQDADTRTAAYEAQKQTYLARHKSEEEASARAAAIRPEADANEHGTGYAADILSTDYTAQDTGFADTRAYQWLTAYAAEYGFILRYPEDRQAITGVVFEPWHWRYVGVENALAIRASGLSLEEFLAEQKAL